MGMNRIVVSVVAFLWFAGGAAGQFPGQGPNLRGIWSPKVGSGAVYEYNDQQQGKMILEIALVGEEKVGGKDAHWLEMRMNHPEEGRFIIKNLVATDPDRKVVLRMIFQTDDEPPMEMSVQMQQMGGGASPVPKDIRESAELVGTEEVTTPAGTFTCEHYRMKDDSVDVWISSKVAPYGIVKMTSKDSSMTLLKLLSDEKSQIRGTPQKMPLMPGMPRP
jgi:hypothetical protein